MTTFFSPFHGLYVAQASKDGYLFTGRGTTQAEAIKNCFRSMTNYAIEQIINPLTNN